jgi:Acetyl-CoA carboxylase, central region
MKMETVLRAPFRARLRECQVAVGSLVETGAPLLRLEPLGDGGNGGNGTAEQETAAGVVIDLPPEPIDVPAAERVASGLCDLRGLLLGFDADPQGGRRRLDRYVAARSAAENGHDRSLAGEIELLEVFADLSELTRNRQAGADAAAHAHVHSHREYFHTYLQSLDAERAGLPEAFQHRLTQVLRHYGVTDLERTPELEDAVFRIFLAQRRAASDAAVVTTLLQQWVTEPPPGEPLRETAGLALEHLVAATQRRFPVVSDLARSVVFRWLAQPILRRNRARVYAGVRRHLSYLDAQPDAPDRAERIIAMVASSEPLVRLLGQRIGRKGAGLGPMLEVLTRRYYGNRSLRDLRVRDVAGCTFVVAEHRDEAGRFAVLATAVDFPALPEAVRAVDQLALADDVAADIYLTWTDQPDDPDAMAAELREVLAAGPLPGQVRRVTAIVAGRSGAVMHHHFTFRPASAGLAEERLIRGLHPLIAQRMQLERLRNFDLTRLPSGDEEVYLFRCVAPKNPSDERLVALAQVRDLTPLRDSDGRLAALPAA